jgi:hypothetical protein
VSSSKKYVLYCNGQALPILLGNAPGKYIRVNVVMGMRPFHDIEGPVVADSTSEKKKSHVQQRFWSLFWVYDHHQRLCHTMWSRKWHNLPHQTVMSSTTDMMDKQKWANASAIRKRSNGSLCSSKWTETWLLSLELVLPPLTRQIWPSDFFSKGYLIVWCDLTKGVMQDSMNISRSLLYRILNSNLQILDRCPGDRCQLISSSLNGHAWNSGGYFFCCGCLAFDGTSVTWG